MAKKLCLLKVFFVAALLSGCAVDDQITDIQSEKAIKVGAAQDRPALQVLHTPKKLVAVLYSDNIFQANSAKFNLQANQSLNQILQIINNHPQTHHIEIVAYSDDTLVSNHFNNNTLLQANNIAAYLWDHGVPHKMISAKAKGAKHYVSSNKTPTGRADNRRVEVNLVYNLTPPLV